MPIKVLEHFHKEEAASLVSKPYKGLPFCPMATSRCSTVAKDGKPDGRIVFDFQQFRNDADGGGQFGINSGLARHDETLLKPLDLMAIKSFAVWLGVLRLCGPVSVAKTDFVGMYHQLLKPASEWWFQVLWATGEGF